MHILVTGAAGMIGARLAAAIGARGRIGDRAVTGLTLVDRHAPPLPPCMPGAGLAADIADPAAAPALIAARPDVIVHLAAVVSGQAEAEAALGYAVNLRGTLALCEAIEAMEGYRPRLVFASSVAVFGAPLPDVVGDGEPPRPLTSYGTQKRMCELLIDDMTRRGALDGVSLRLPTICVRPGAPNAAASGFFSSILREPLAGRDAVLPVDGGVSGWFASPRAAVGYLLHAAAMDTAPLGQDRALNMPGVGATVDEQIAALGRRAGPKAVARIRRVHDPVVAGIVGGWPRAFDPARAVGLGFAADADMDAILSAHVEDELGGVLPDASR